MGAQVVARGGSLERFATFFGGPRVPSPGLIYMCIVGHQQNCENEEVWKQPDSPRGPDLNEWNLADERVRQPETSPIPHERLDERFRVERPIYPPFGKGYRVITVWLSERTDDCRAGLFKLICRRGLVERVFWYSVPMRQ